MNNQKFTNKTLNQKKYINSPFGEYFRRLDEIDKKVKYTREYGSFLILGLLEELGEMSRAYLAKHGRKPTNIAALEDETYEQELGDILVAVLRFARIKGVNLDERITYTLDKLEKRKTSPKR
jgi:NTP pyrophosphatase (non-canonical NTP hydrolase)